MTRTLTLQVPKNRQHDTTLQSVQPHHQDCISPHHNVWSSERGMDIWGAGAFHRLLVRLSG